MGFSGSAGGGGAAARGGGGGARRSFGTVDLPTGAGSDFITGGGVTDINFPGRGCGLGLGRDTVAEDFYREQKEDFIMWSVQV